MRVRRKAAATIADIGRELGVSAMTVSRALNGSAEVSEETRRRVLTHAERLKYRPNRWARSLVTRKSKIIGMVVPDISHSYFSEITRAVQESVEPHGYDLMLCHTHGDVVREQAAIEMLLGSRVEGLVVASQRPETDPGVYSELCQLGTPFVLLDRYFPDLDCARVRADDRLVGQIATRHLLSLGHRKIAHLRGPPVSVGRLRFEGYCDALTDFGLPVRQNLILDSGFSMDGGYASMKKLLDLSEPPTAVFAGNDPSAIGAVRACRDFGLRVPEDMSIIGAGAVEGSLYPNPFLTTVDWSRDEMGSAAAQLLLDAIAGTAVVRDKVAAPELLIRQSTAPLILKALTQCASF